MTCPRCSRTQDLEAVRVSAAVTINLLGPDGAVFASFMPDMYRRDGTVTLAEIVEVALAFSQMEAKSEPIECCPSRVRFVSDGLSGPRSGFGCDLEKGHKGAHRSGAVAWTHDGSDPSERLQGGAWEDWQHTGGEAL